MLRHPRAPAVQAPSGQTTAQHGNCDGAQRQAVMRNRQPGDKHANGQSYPRACYQTRCTHRHDSFVEPTGVRSSDFFDQAESQKDQQSHSLIAPRGRKTRLQERTLWLPEASHERQRECSGYQCANIITNRIHREIGVVNGLWLDPSTLHLAFIGVASLSLPHIIKPRGKLSRIVPTAQYPGADPADFMAVDFLRRIKSCGIKRAYLEYSPSSMMNSIDSARKCDSCSSMARPSWR